MNREGSVERSREQFNIVYETVYGGIIMIHIEEVSVILMLMFGVVVSYVICTLNRFCYIVVLRSSAKVYCTIKTSFNTNLFSAINNLCFNTRKY